MAWPGCAMAGGLAAAQLAREHRAAQDLLQRRHSARQALAAFEQLAFCTFHP